MNELRNEILNYKEYQKQYIVPRKLFQLGVKTLKLEF